MFHAESDSRFEIDASELPSLYDSCADGALCVDVTGDPAHEEAFARQR